MAPTLESADGVDIPPSLDYPPYSSQPPWPDLIPSAILRVSSLLSFWPKIRRETSSTKADRFRRLSEN